MYSRTTPKQNVPKSYIWTAMRCTFVLVKMVLTVLEPKIIINDPQIFIDIHVISFYIQGSVLLRLVRKLHVTLQIPKVVVIYDFWSCVLLMTKYFLVQWRSTYSRSYFLPVYDWRNIKMRSLENDDRREKPLAMTIKKQFAIGSDLTACSEDGIHYLSPRAAFHLDKSESQ